MLNLVEYGEKGHLGRSVRPTDYSGLWGCMSTPRYDVSQQFRLFPNVFLVGLRPAGSSRSPNLRGGRKDTPTTVSPKRTDSRAQPTEAHTAGGSGDVLIASVHSQMATPLSLLRPGCRVAACCAAPNSYPGRIRMPTALFELLPILGPASWISSSGFRSGRAVRH
jgi:hypothetical protein